MFESLKAKKNSTKENEERGFGWKAGRVGAAASNALWDHADNPDAPPPYDMIFDEKLGKFARTQALFAVLRDMVPDTFFNKIAGDRYQYRGEVLPIDPKLYQFESRKIGAGAECNVYKLTSLDPDCPSLVIKIDNGPRRDVDTLISRGKKIRSEYEAVKDWYRELPELIPEEMQFISKSPRGGRNALFTVQEYAGTADQIHDVFRGYASRDQLAGIIKSDPELQETFRKFIRVTLEHAEDHDEFIDTVGDRNLVLIDRPDGRKVLRLLDSHVVKHPKHPTNNQESTLMQSDLSFLNALSKIL